VPEYILPLSSADTTLALAGGKGSNLAELVRAAFPVPGGFIVTTDAYHAFVEANQLQQAILRIARSISPADPSAFENSSAQIRILFEHGAIPPEIAADIISGYRGLLPYSPAYASYASSASSNVGDAPATAFSDTPVAVRSSATAEDLPGLAFAGQQDTYLNVIGEGAVPDAVKQCWASLWTARALAYRARNNIPPDEVALAVIVQEMVASESSGVLFTANPLTGRRDEMVIDASFGLGEAVVSGQVDPDHYVVNPHTWEITRRKIGTKEISIIPRAGGGTEQVRRVSTSGKAGARVQALADIQIIELAKIARRVGEHFGSPQDIEWAWSSGQLYLLQSRPITSLYPLPALPTAPEVAGSAKNSKPGESLHVYISFNSIQGVTDPFTPMGIDALRMIFGGVPRLLHIRSSPREFLPDAGGRLFLDFTAPVRDPRLRNLVLAFLSRVDPGAQQTLRRLIAEGRFAPKKVVIPPRQALTLLLAMLPTLRAVIAALLRPERVRPRVLAIADRFVNDAQQHARAAKDLPATLRAMERDLAHAESISFAVMPTVLPAFAALPLVDRWLSRWLGEKAGAALPLMQGLPGNMTIEMNLKLWAAAQAIRADPAALEAMTAQPVEALVREYRQGNVPATAQRELGGFLREYGMRGVAEIDFGRFRWRDDPTPIVQTLRAYLQLENPDLAPDVLFRRGAEQAERLAAEYVRRARKTPLGWLRAALLGGAIRRIRILAGLREAPLFYLVRVEDIYRSALLERAREIVAHDDLERPDDIFYVPFDSLKRYSRGKGVDLKGIVATKRADYERECARKQMPRVLLSTGEAFYGGVSDASEVSEGGNDLMGEAVSPGVAEGRVHVILDPRTERLEPGEILVCRSTDPGWTPLFLTAGGLVMEIGGLITHGSVVAREYGIPAVVGVHEATTRLKTGQHLRVDGNRGIVTILES
jgi:phosphohistidine swiveling domain-containing protein